jgi:hypothetical protein
MEVRVRVPAEANEAAIEPGDWVDMLDQGPSGREVLDPPVRPVRNVLAVTSGEQLCTKRIRNELILESFAPPRLRVHVRYLNPVIRK